MSSDDFQTIVAFIGTAAVLQRATAIDLREFRPTDIAVLIILAIGSRRVVSV